MMSALGWMMQFALHPFADLNSLGFGNEQVGEGGYDQIPEQMGSFPDPPQPGPYRFQMPDLATIQKSFDKVDSQKGPRLASRLPLTIKQAADHNKEFLNTSFDWRVTNVERKIKDLPGEWSDMDFLLVNAFKSKARPKTNQQYAQELAKYAGKDFGAEAELSAYCNDQKPIYVAETDEAGNATGRTVPLDGKDGRDDVKGCGTRYYQKDVPREEGGRYAVRMTCQCGAELRCNAQLRRFKE